MPNTPTEQEPAPDEPGDAIPPEGANEQEQDAPRGHAGKTFLEHGEDVMNEHAELLRLLAQ